MNRLAAAFAAASLALASAPARDTSAGPQQPEVLNSVKPGYPPIAKAVRASGEVVVRVRVDAGGSVAEAEALSGHPLLQRASRDAAAQWRFKRDMRGTTLQLTFEFRLDPPAEGPGPASPYHVFVDAVRQPATARFFTEEDEGKVCELHGFRLEQDTIEIGHAPCDPDGTYDEARKTSFPHANSWVVLGGCVRTDEDPRFAEVLHCRACRAAEARWLEEHGRGPDCD